MIRTLVNKRYKEKHELGPLRSWFWFYWSFIGKWWFGVGVYLNRWAISILVEVIKTLSLLLSRSLSYLSHLLLQLFFSFLKLKIIIIKGKSCAKKTLCCRRVADVAKILPLSSRREPKQLTSKQNKTRNRQNSRIIKVGDHVTS